MGNKRNNPNYNSEGLTPQQVAQRNRSYGNAKTGAVAPGAKIPSKPADTPASDLKLNNEGFGDVVSDLQYTTGEKRLLVSKLLLNTQAGRLRYGRVVGGNAGNTITATTELTEPEDWEDADLPSDYDHGDAVPTMPDGMGYVRLGRGSLQVDSFAWNADDSSFGATGVLTYKYPDVVHPQLFSSSVIKLWFNQTVIATSTINDTFISTKIALRTDKSIPIYATGVSISGNVATITLNRSVEDEEDVHIKINQDFVRNQQTSNTGIGNPGTAFMTCVRTLARDAYVKVVNRFGLDTLNNADPVLVSGPNPVFDNDGRLRYVYDIVPLGSGSGSAEPRVFGVVYQGNTHPASGAGTMGDPYVYPTNKPFLFALGSTEDPESPEDWTELDLPADFEHGDPLPDELPSGVAYVRLSRGSASIGSSSWDADLATYGSTESGAAGSPTLVKAFVRNHNELWLYFDEAVDYLNPSPIGDYLDVISDDLGAPGPLDLHATYFLGQSDNILKFKLNRDVVTTETITVTFANPGLCEDFDGSPNDNEVVTNFPVEFWGARNCYVLVVNRYANKTFRQGDLLDIFGGMDLDDEQDPVNTRTLYDVLPRVANAQVPHRHLTEDADGIGGGLAFTSMPPVTWAEYIAFGYPNLVPGVEV